MALIRVMLFKKACFKMSKGLLHPASHRVSEQPWGKGRAYATRWIDEDVAVQSTNPESAAKSLWLKSLLFF